MASSDDPTDQNVDHYVMHITITVQPINKYGDVLVGDSAITLRRTIVDKSLGDVVTRMECA
jgi:hypothetical protein